MTTLRPSPRSHSRRRPRAPLFDSADDLGRRVRERRQDLGLSREQLAERAGTAAGFLEYLETDPAASFGLTSSALLRLSSALETTTAALTGGGRERAAGFGSPGVNPRLISLPASECRHRLASAGVGRVAFQAGDELLVLPVNFRLVDGDIVFRAARNGRLAAIGSAPACSFEVDRIDPVSGEGWSVLAQGAGTVVFDPEEAARLELEHIEPWAGGDRPLFVRLRISRISGRRIATSWA